MSGSRSAPATSPVSPTLSIQTHDSCPPAETAIVDNGIGEFNDAAAPLHEGAPLSSFRVDPAGGVVAARSCPTLGRCCELQQQFGLPQHRRRWSCRGSRLRGPCADSWLHCFYGNIRLSGRQISTARSGTTASPACCLSRNREACDAEALPTRSLLSWRVKRAAGQSDRARQRHLSPRKGFRCHHDVWYGVGGCSGCAIGALQRRCHCGAPCARRNAGCCSAETLR